MTMTPEQYTETLIPLCMRLVATVHDEGPDAVAGVLAAIRALPAPDGVDPADAVAVVLAAAINPNLTANALWGWIRLAGDPNTTPATVPTGHAANALAIEMGLSGALPLHALAESEQAVVIDTLVVTRRWSINAIAAHLDAEPAEVHRIRHNSKRRTNRGRTRKAAA